MQDGFTAPRRPALPAGRHVELPGRGRTFVRELPGPPGAPVVVLLHGWMATADLNWFPAFGPLARHFRVVAPDHRGHGRGLRPTERFRLEHCADDVAALARELRLPAFTAVGYSMGGAIAQLLCQRHAPLVQGLVLCATSAHFTGSWRERTLFGLLQAASPLTRTAVLDAVAGSARAACRTWADSRPWSLDEVLRHDWGHVLDAGRALGRFDSRRWLADIGVRTAVLATAHDTIVPLERQLALADGIPGASVRQVAGGHASCTEVPELFVPALVRACREVNAADLVAAA